MKYILDFDRVLFDHDLLKQVMEEKKLTHLYARPELWDEINPNDFMNTDVVPFLKQLPKNDVYIVSAFTARIGPQAEPYQARKLFESGIDMFVHKIILMDGPKAPHVKNVCTGAGVFVDDKRVYVEEVARECPQIMSIQLLRPDAERTKFDIPDVKHASIPVVENLQQVTAIINSL